MNKTRRKRNSRAKNTNIWVCCYFSAQDATEEEDVIKYLFIAFLRAYWTVMVLIDAWRHSVQCLNAKEVFGGPSESCVEAVVLKFFFSYIFPWTQFVHNSHKIELEFL